MVVSACETGAGHMQRALCGTLRFAVAIFQPLAPPLRAKVVNRDRSAWSRGSFATGRHVASASATFHSFLREADVEAVVLVASSNPAKVEAVKAAIATLSGRELHVRVAAIAVDSNVPPQPFGDAETLRGALSRCRNVAQDIAAARAFPVGTPPALPNAIVAIEGGVGWVPRLGSDGQVLPTPPKSADALSDGWQLECFAWVAARDGTSGAESTARSASFPLPGELARLVLSGMELGDADDQFFKRQQSGRGIGTIGRLSDGRIPRSDYYAHACSMALLPFLHPELYASN